MHVRIAEGPVHLRPVPHHGDAVPQVMLTVQLTQAPDTEWLAAFHSDSMARQFYSVRPKDFTMNGAQCSYKCQEGKHERVLRVLRKIIELCNARSEQSVP